MVVLGLNILGPFEIRRDGQQIVLKSRKQRFLLIDLILSAGEVVSRERIIEDLWGDQAPASVEVTLSSYVSTVRSSLEPKRERGSRGTVLITRDPGYMLDTTNVTIDAHEFERLVGDASRVDSAQRAARLDQALALVRGTPLSDVQYEEFAAPELRRLSELILSTREQSIELALDRGEHRALAGELEQLVQDHPLREGLRAQFMLALYRNGRQADALRVFSDGRERLVDELGLEPGPPLVELESRILAQDPSLLEIADPAATTIEASPTSAVAGSTMLTPEVPKKRPAAKRDPLFGREPEIAFGRELMADLRGGISSTLLIGGAPGIGKSRLVRELLDIATESCDLAVCFGSCLEGAPPINAWARAMSSYVADQGSGVLEHLSKPVLRDMFRLFPDGAGQVGMPRPELVTDHDEALELLDNIANAALAVSRYSPLVCVIEDLHLAGAGTLQVFTRVAESVADGSFLLMGTYRDDALHLTTPLRDATARIAGKTRVNGVQLGGLDFDASHELIEQVVGADLSRSAAASLVDRTGGNPLYLTELARAATATSTGFDASVPVSREVGDAIRQRIATLPADVVELLQVCSFTSGSLHPGVDALVLEADIDEVERRYDIAFEAGIVEDDPGVPGNLRFVQQLVREALYDGLSSRRRARTHAKLGAAVEQHVEREDQAIAAAIARHYVLGTPAGTRVQGIDWSIRAAQQASNLLEHGEAFFHWSTAIELLDQDLTTQRRLRCQALLGLGLAGRGSQQIERATAAFLEAFSSAREIDDAVLMAEIALGFSEGIGTRDAQVWWRPGRTALDALDEALAVVDAQVDPALAELTIMLLTRRASDGIDLASGDRRAYIDRAAAMAVELGDPAVRCHVHASSIIALWDVLKVDELLERATSGVKLSTDLADQALELQMRRWSAGFTLMSGDHSEAARLTDEANRRAALFGPRFARFAPQTLQPMLDFIVGRYEQAEVGHRSYLGETSTMKLLSGTHVVALVNLEWHRGNIAAWVGAIESHATATRQAGIFAMLALIHVHNDDLPSARRVIDGLRRSEIDEYGGASNNGLLPWAMAQVAAALGDQAMVESMYARLGLIEHKLVLPGPAIVPIGLVDQALGRAALFLGDLDAAQTHIDHAYTLLDALGAVPWRFQTDLVAADLYVAQGDLDRARTLLHETTLSAIETGTKLAAEAAERALVRLT